MVRDPRAHDPSGLEDLHRGFIWKRMASTYANDPHVFYEICNEPTGAGWSEDIVPYAKDVIAEITAENLELKKGLSG